MAKVKIKVSPRLIKLQESDYLINYSYQLICKETEDLMFREDRKILVDAMHNAILNDWMQNCWAKWEKRRNDNEYRVCGQRSGSDSKTVSGGN